MNKIFKLFFMIFLFVMSFFCVVSVDGTKVQAASYDSYYTSVNTTSGQNLISSLRKIISNGHSTLSYSGLWGAYYDTDLKPGTNYIWDMYSNHNFTVGSDQAGNFSKEGDKYNREHSVPKSWFNDAAPMHNDLFHVYPTDGYVNGKRSNYPFGEVDNPSYTSGNGSKLGDSSFPGYSGTVFEPIDEYKGDFARTYFYMATRYNSEGTNTFSHTSEGKAVFTSSYPYLTTYATNLFIKWHTEDPVSEKEINRNNAVQTKQKNRNPYIDHPEYVNVIWGDGELEEPAPSTYKVTYSCGSEVTFNYTDNTEYTSGSLISKPNVTPVKTGFEFVGWTANTNTRELWDFNTNKITKNLTLYPLFKANSPEAFTGDVSTIKTQLLANFNEIESATKATTASGYKKVESASELNVGDKILIVNDTNKKAISTTQNKNNRGTADIVISNDSISEINSGVEVITLDNGSSDGTFALSTSSGYLYAASGGNYLRTQSTLDANASFKIDIASGIATIISQTSSDRNQLMYNPNNGSPIFGCYKAGTQTAVSIYKEVAGVAKTYEATDVGIRFSYYVSLDIYNAFVDDYDFGFEYDTEVLTNVYTEQVTYNGKSCVRVSISFDNITDYTKTYSVKPILVKEQQKSYGVQSTAYNVKTLAEYYLNSYSGNDSNVAKYRSLLESIMA